MISVIIPTYNREKTVLRSVASVLNQTYKDIELIVVDDGSTDGTNEILEEITDPRFQHIRLDRNRGANYARNEGLSRAKGAYIAFQDSDDEWLPEKLETELDALNRNDADLCFCPLQICSGDEKSGVIGDWYKEGFINGVGNVWGIGTQTILCKAEIFRKYPFDTAMPRYQDLEWLMRVCRNYKIYCVAQPLVSYYPGTDSITGNPQKGLKASMLLREKHPDIKEVYPVTAEALAHTLLTEAIALPKDDAARKELRREALRLDSGMANRARSLLVRTGYCAGKDRQMR